MSLLGNTLRDVANESALEKPERVSLRLIAKEVDTVYAENKRIKTIADFWHDECKARLPNVSMKDLYKKLKQVLKTGGQE